MPMHEHGIPRRITYLIDPAGVIRKAYDMEDGQPDLALHAPMIIADIQELATS